MDEVYKAYTIFVTRYGTFSFEVMPFGHIKALSTIQQIMDHLLKKLFC